jgi:PAS domain-containing protein
VSLSAALADALLSGRSDAIIVADRDGIIRFWNPGRATHIPLFE